MTTRVYVKVLKRSLSLVEVQGLKNNANFTECDFLAIYSLSYALYERDTVIRFVPAIANVV